MYYTTSGAYRKSKMLIDYATIALTAVIMISNRLPGRSAYQRLIRDKSIYE